LMYAALFYVNLKLANTKQTLYNIFIMEKNPEFKKLKYAVPSELEDYYSKKPEITFSGVSVDGQIGTLHIVPRIEGKITNEHLLFDHDTGTETNPHNVAKRLALFYGLVNEDSSSTCQQASIGCTINDRKFIAVCRNGKWIGAWPTDEEYDEILDKVASRIEKMQS
jgi:hypothetical protein